MRGRQRRRGGDAGQAVTETMMASWIIILFVAAIYQLFLANQTVYRSLAVAHTELMRDAFTWNCAGNDLPFAPPGPWCDYQGGLSRIMHPGEPARVIYNRYMVPEVFMPVVGIFADRAAGSFSSDQSTVYGRLAHAIFSNHRIPPFGAVTELRLWSGSALHADPDEGCGMRPMTLGTGEVVGAPESPSCKRTKAGAGPYLPLADAFLHMAIAGGPGGAAAIPPDMTGLAGAFTQLQNLALQGGLP